MPSASNICVVCCTFINSLASRWQLVQALIITWLFITIRSLLAHLTGFSNLVIPSLNHLKLSWQLTNLCITSTLCTSSVNVITSQAPECLESLIMSISFWASLTNQQHTNHIIFTPAQLHCSELSFTVLSKMCMFTASNVMGAVQLTDLLFCIQQSISEWIIFPECFPAPASCMFYPKKISGSFPPT